MQATHDHYHGITLPEPPAGYRLAKWGEDVLEKSLWWDGDEKGKNGIWDHDWCSKWPWSKWQSYLMQPWMCIFAIPLNQPPTLKSWRFREVPWVVPEPKTLADAIDGVDVICATGKGHCPLKVMCRRGDTAYYRYVDGTSTPSTFSPQEVWFVRYLNPPPQKPMSLDDVPDGRVVQFANGLYLWRADGKLYCRHSDGLIYCEAMTPTDFTITNYIAEFRGPA